MNAFYKVKVGYWGEDGQEHSGAAVGNDEGAIMNQVMEYYGRENVEQVSFWFSENCENDVIELKDFKECPLFDFH